MQNNNPTVGALRVWHIPQVPGKSFRVNVSSIEQAKLMIDTLANYDLFQLQNRIKPDYCNASGLERYESDAGDGVPGWCEWYDEETGDEVVRINMSREIEMDRAAANLGDRVQVPAELVGGGDAMLSESPKVVAADGCGACGDGCNGRICRLEQDSPQVKGGA